ncbi:unnamed protein product [Urochloa humidicola]
MMGAGGEFKSSLLQQMMWSGGTDSKNMMSSLMPCAEEEEASNKMTMPPLSSPSMLLPQHLHQISSSLTPEVNSRTATSLAGSDLHDGQESNMPESWSQLLLGGLVGDHESYSTATALLSKGLEEGHMPQAAATYNFYGHGGGEEIRASGTNKSQVRKERLGDRITALHQIVSPFGKTDTASVLQETIGYIRFLLNQIEGLSFPYLGHGNGSSMQQQHTVASLLINHSTGNAEGPTEQDEGNVGDENKKDLRSRGLCLVPVSCTSHLAGDDSGASDFWAVAAAPPPPPLGDIIWR